MTAAEPLQTSRSEHEESMLLCRCRLTANTDADWPHTTSACSVLNVVHDKAGDSHHCHCSMNAS